MEEKKSKILIPTIVAVITLIVLVVGATYAYFTVGATNNFETRTIEASADSVGVVTLTSNENNLYLNLPAHLMMKDQIPEDVEYISYYGVTDPDGLPTTTSPKYIAATFTLTGEGTYECSVDFDLTISGSMFSVAQSNSSSDAIPPIFVILSSDDVFYFEHYTERAIITGTGTLTSSADCDAGNCSGNFKFNIGGTNGNVREISEEVSISNIVYIDQSYLAGTSMTVDFDITDFSCTAIS